MTNRRRRVILSGAKNPLLPVSSVRQKGLVCFCAAGAKIGSASVRTGCPACHRQAGFYGSSPFLFDIPKKTVSDDTVFFGTPEGTRTPNPRNRNPMLYPLSHWRIHLKCLAIIADKAGFVKSQMAKKSLRVRVHPERMGVTPLPGRCAHRPAASGRRCWGRPSSGPGRSCSWGR